MDLFWYPGQIKEFVVVILVAIGIGFGLGRRRYREQPFRRW